MKVVQFEHGSWALRKWSLTNFRWVYLDITGGGINKWRTRSNDYFHDCLADSEHDLLNRAIFKREMLNRRVVQKKKLKELDV